MLTILLILLPLLDANLIIPPEELQPIECRDKQQNCASLRDRCHSYVVIEVMKKHCAKTCGFCETIPCDARGGQIKQRDCCPFWIDGDRRQCTKYDVCVCRDGFVGDSCEHDCEVNIFPAVLAPVCARDGANGVDITFPNKYLYFNARCNKEFVYFKYNGECQDDALCGGPIYCPMDTAVEYYDDPDRPGCKLCRSAPSKC